MTVVDTGASLMTSPCRDGIKASTSSSPARHGPKCRRCHRWSCRRATGVGLARIYLIEPTGPIENDPNLRDKKFPRNPTKSYRSREPLRVTAEIMQWQGRAPDVLRAMKDHLEQLREMGVEAIDNLILV